jgi:pantetheine-phosphate adenylyltransferase
MNNTAVYPGTFDPITNGHIDICERAARLFDEVVLAVAVDTAKQTFFDLSTRLELAQTVFAQSSSIVVEPFEGLLVNFARERNARIILRGLRAVSDFEYEFQLAGMNRSLDRDIETLFLTPADQYAFLSSSLVREVAMLGGDVSRFVHPVVGEALAARRK